MLDQLGAGNGGRGFLVRFFAIVIPRGGKWLISNPLSMKCTIALVIMKHIDRFLLTCVHFGNMAMLDTNVLER